MPPPGVQRLSTGLDDTTALALAARDGDAAAFEQLVRATYAETYTLAYRLLSNEEDARDVTQEVYLRAYRGLRRFRGDAQVTTWLHRITANTAMSQRSRRLRHRHERLDPDLAVVDGRPEHDPVGKADADELRRRVEGALRELPARLRAVVVLRDVYDLTHDAIASELGISETAAKVRLHRARRKLRDRLFAEEAGRDL